MPRVLVDLLSYTGTKGGMETYARELYRELGATPSDYEYVGFASSELMTRDTSWFPGKIINSRISGENRFTWAFGEMFSVARAAKRIRADLIHSPALLGPIRSAMPTVITMHDVLYFSHPELMSTGFYTKPVRWMERKAADNATRIMTDSESSAVDIVKYLKFDPTRLDVVPLAGTVQVGERTARVAPAAGAGGLILATGNRRPHKNWEGLVRALALVPEKIRPRLVVTGSHGEDPLAPVVSELGLERWVDLKSWVSSEELAELYDSASALAMPSFCDGFSLPALDAMMAGVPVMISNIPVYREVTGDAGLYFEPTELSSIAAAIERAVTDPALMSTLVEKGYQQAAGFSWGRVATRTLECFDASLGRIELPGYLQR
ncbi:MAG: glycosyltransferase family 4 protein [Microbacteriaceae bacterium]|nr:glycosyltransferase family 4 protein [Microbacteriaceae bacterium]